MLSNVKVRRVNISEVLLVCTIVTSIFSQIDSLEFVARPLMYILWILLFISSIIVRKSKLHISKGTKVYAVVYFIFAMFCIICGCFNSAFFESKYLKVLLIPLIIILYTDICPFSVVENYMFYAKVFVLASLFFAVTVQRTYISSYRAWLLAHSYVYEQKNSAAQIWMCAVLLCWFVIKTNNKLEQMLWYGASAFLLILSGLSQCRTAILALGVGIVVVILFRSKYKIRWSFLFLFIVVFLFINPKTYQYLNQALLLERYAGADLNTMSSGRIVGYGRAFDAFWRSPFIGVGSWYVDCSYLSILAESGIIGFFLIETIWMNKLHNTLSFNFNGENVTSEKNFFLLISVFYIVESMLEAFPPFGPGVSTLGFWLFIGLITRYYEFDKKLYKGDIVLVK